MQNRRTKPDCGIPNKFAGRTFVLVMPRSFTGRKYKHVVYNNNGFGRLPGRQCYQYLKINIFLFF